MDLKFDKSGLPRLGFLLIAPLSLLLVAPHFLVNVHAAEILLNDSNLDVEIVAEGLKSPSSMALLNPNETLVLEKDEGKVLRVVNGHISDNAALTLHIDDHDERRVTHNERGLLGIALPRDLEGEDGNVESVPKYVFLFYTEANNGGNGNVNGNVNVNVKGNCEQQGCEESQYNNRLYRYEFKDNKLVNGKLLIDIPLYWNNRVYPSTHSEIIHGGSEWSRYPLREGIHNGGALVMDYDNNVYLITGDGGGCHDYDGCYRSIENGFLSVKSANKKDGSNPTGMGGVLRVKQNGEPVNNEGILGDEHPLNFYYAYGIRNSFGIDFDPVTGKLWDTENGPHYGDEINLVEPGFNSGWAKIQGIWSVKNYTDLQFNGTQKGHSYDASTVPVYNDFEDFSGKGQYSDPEFTWNDSIGVTSIRFLNTDKLGKQYENDVFVGDAIGRIYHFDLNKNRTELDLNGPLSDKVANSESELQDSIFGQGFDTVTDMEVGPDGYLYVLSYSGKIYKIFPKDDS